jgi:hypothetical protein
MDQIQKHLLLTELTDFTPELQIKVTSFIIVQSVIRVNLSNIAQLEYC